MADTLPAMTVVHGVFQKVDRVLFSFSKAYLIVVILAIQSLLFYADFLTGPLVPFGVFYLLNLYISAKYVGSRFSYLLAFVVVVGKTYIRVGFYPEDALWWHGQWQFISNLTIYNLFCYLINSQIKGLKRAEDALDKLSRLNEAIVTNAESGILVFKEDGECLIANYAAARILGRSLDQLRQLNYKKDVAWSASGLRAAGQQAMRNGEELKFTSKLCMVEGHEVWCVTSMRQIKRAETSYMLMVFTDISAYREAEDAKQRADKETAVALARAGVAERKLLSISEETQQRIGRELHDDLGQHLMGAAFMSEVLFQKLKEAKRVELHDAAKVTTLLNEAMSKTRLLAHGLYPAELSEHGLCKMLEKFAGYVEGIYKIECDFYCQSGCHIDDAEIAINLFRIAQEAVTNAVKHGRAKHISLRVLKAYSGQLTLEILDDGCGMANLPTITKGSGLGMRTMQYRAELIGASLEVRSRDSGGTVVAVSFPEVHQVLTGVYE